MNVKKQLLIAAAVCAVAGAAFAGDNTEYVDHSKFVSTKTRAEVRAELEKAYAEGWRLSAVPEFVEFTSVASNNSRDDVRQAAVEPAKKQ